MISLEHVPFVGLANIEMGAKGKVHEIEWKEKRNRPRPPFIKGGGEFLNPEDVYFNLPSAAFQSMFLKKAVI